MAIAMRRSGSWAFDGILSIDQTLRERVFSEVHIKDAFGVSQCFGAVDVLPMCVADIKGSQFLLTRKLAHTIRQRTVPVSFCRFEPVEECRAAQKHPGVEDVITGEIFADIDDMV